MNVSCLQLTPYLNSVRSVIAHRQQQHTTKLLQNDTIALSMNSFRIVVKMVFQLSMILVSFGASLIAFQHSTPHMTINWHIHMVHWPSFLHHSRILVTCSLRKMYKKKISSNVVILNHSKYCNKICYIHGPNPPL